MIFQFATNAWDKYQREIQFVEDQSRVFAVIDDRRFVNLIIFTEGLQFTPDYYCPRPKMVNGLPYFESAIPYNACYVPSHDELIRHREFNPVDMWLGDRWILMRRIYG